MTKMTAGRTIVDNIFRQSREYDQVCMFGNFLLEPCVTLGILGPRDSLRDLHSRYSKSGNYSEDMLAKIQELVAKVEREFRLCCDDIVQGWNMDNWEKRN